MIEASRLAEALLACHDIFADAWRAYAARQRLPRSLYVPSSAVALRRHDHASGY